MDKMGATAYAQMKDEIPQSNDAAAIRLVTCVANAVTAEVRMPNAPRSWEVTVFEDDSANAFALPGGKIGVHTGLFKVAKNQAQLATVLGHEVAHVLAQHSNERASTQLATSGALAALETLSGPASPAKSRTIAVLGAGAQVGVILPFSRSQESEADVLGLDLMARAGFDPREGAALWENMAKLGSSGPEILSTHPSSSSRIAALKERAKIAMPLYEQARAAGKRPSCG
jgi:predicted Zn-dependent protease